MFEHVDDTSPAASHGLRIPIIAAPSDIARLQHPALPIKVRPWASRASHIVIEILASLGPMAGINWSLWRICRPLCALSCLGCSLRSIGRIVES